MSSVQPPSLRMATITSVLAIPSVAEVGLAEPRLQLNLYCILLLVYRAPDGNRMKPSDVLVTDLTAGVHTSMFHEYQLGRRAVGRLDGLRLAYAHRKSRDLARRLGDVDIHDRVTADVSSRCVVVNVTGYLKTYNAQIEGNANSIEPVSDADMVRAWAEESGPLYRLLQRIVRIQDYAPAIKQLVGKEPGPLTQRHISHEDSIYISEDEESVRMPTWEHTGGSPKRARYDVPGAADGFSAPVLAQSTAAAPNPAGTPPPASPAPGRDPENGPAQPVSPAHAIPAHTAPARTVPARTVLAQRPAEPEIPQVSGPPVVAITMEQLPVLLCEENIGTRYRLADVPLVGVEPAGAVIVQPYGRTAKVAPFSIVLRGGVIEFVTAAEAVRFLGHREEEDVFVEYGAVAQAFRQLETRSTVSLTITIAVHPWRELYWTGVSPLASL